MIHPQRFEFGRAYHGEQHDFRISQRVTGAYEKIDERAFIEKDAFMCRIPAGVEVKKVVTFGKVRPLSSLNSNLSVFPLEFNFKDDYGIYCVMFFLREMEKSCTINFGKHFNNMGFMGLRFFIAFGGLNTFSISSTMI